MKKKKKLRNSLDGPYPAFWTIKKYLKKYGSTKQKSRKLKLFVIGKNSPPLFFTRVKYISHKNVCKRSLGRIIKSLKLNKCVSNENTVMKTNEGVKVITKERDVLYLWPCSKAFNVRPFQLAVLVNNIQPKLLKIVRKFQKWMLSPRVPRSHLANFQFLS